MSYIKYPKPTPEQFVKIGSETERYRWLTAPFCKGAGVDIGSQGVPVVPWAISFDLPEKAFLHYSSGHPAKGPIHLRGMCDTLPFDSESLDWAYASHLLEDFFDWLRYLTEWCRCVKVGGYIIILVPDKKLWDDAVARGQPCNCAHKHESHVGELSDLFTKYYGHFEVVMDQLTAVTPEDYTIIFVAKRVR